MNANQEVFYAITGFKASHQSIGASMDYDVDSYSAVLELVTATVEYADDFNLSIESDAVDCEKVAAAIVEYETCETGNGCDLDFIFESLA